MSLRVGVRLPLLAALQVFFFFWFWDSDCHFFPLESAVLVLFACRHSFFWRVFLTLHSRFLSFCFLGSLGLARSRPFFFFSPFLPRFFGQTLPPVPLHCRGQCVVFSFPVFVFLHLFCRDFTGVRPP